MSNRETVEFGIRTRLIEDAAKHGLEPIIGDGRRCSALELEDSS
jgi:hypothetical protein